MQPATVIAKVAFSDEYHPKIPSDCPAELAELITRCFDLEPEDRPPFSSTVRTLNKMYNVQLQLEKEKKEQLEENKTIQ